MLNKSPSQRFYRTRNYHLSPNIKQNQVEDREKYGVSSEKVKFLSASSSTSNLRPTINIQKFSQIYKENRQIQRRNTLMPKVQENQQNKKQLQLSELFSMISSIQYDQRNTERINDNQLIKEKQLLRTPRQNNIQFRDIQRDQIVKKFQIQIPICQQKKEYITQKCNNNQFSQYFSINQLQALLQKIQKDTERNSNKIYKIQEVPQKKQFSLKQNTTQQSKQIPFSIQNFVKQQCRQIQNQIQIQNNILQSWISKQVSQKITQKNIIDKFQGRLQEQISKIYSKMSTISQFFNEQVHSLEKRTSNQIYTLNDIVQQKMSFFKQSLIDQMLVVFHKQANQLKEALQFEKNRLNSNQQENLIVFNEFKKQLREMQQKMIQAEYNKNVDDKLKEKFLNQFFIEKQLMYQQLKSQISIKIRQNQNDIWRQIRNISKKLQNVSNKTAFLPQREQQNSQKISNSKKDMSGPSTPSEQSAGSFNTQKFLNNIALQLKIRSVVSEFSYLQDEIQDFQQNDIQIPKNEQVSEIIPLNQIQMYVDN